ncbi:hypothetical protein M9Y10_003809 [Tritrichomonas musculus]|uniref:FAD:protein FMN transferase n=1 Tax=Tritrichomonas musculus TaxID=1915356 RepID=A0ABR2JQB3_9EUKA
MTEEKEGIYNYTTVLMGSPILLKLFKFDEQLVSHVFGVIKHYEDIFTVNRDQSEVMDINHAAGVNSVSVSQPVFDLIKVGKQASMIKNSSFNLAIGPLVKLWKIGFKGDKVPPDDEIQDALQITNPSQIIIDERTRSVFLTQRRMEIDLGAIAKGYIADRVRDYLLHENIKEGLINLGGNILTLGSPNGSWSIGLKKPFSKKKDQKEENEKEDFVGTIELENMSVVTSGIYERYFEQDGKMYHHILDPKTGYPINNELESVTIISKNSIDGDIWSTLIFGMGLEKGFIVASRKPELEGIFLTKNHEVFITSTDKFRFTLLDNSYHIVDFDSR